MYICIPRYMQIFGFHLLCVSSAPSFSTIDSIEKCWVPRNKAKYMYSLYVFTQAKLKKKIKKKKNGRNEQNEVIKAGGKGNK